MIRKSLLLVIASLIFIVPSFVLAQDSLGQSRIFNVEPTYDLSKRTELTATLIKISPRVYWYVDELWWQKLDSSSQEGIRQSLNSLTEEFEGRIYPILTQTFGLEWSPGIDQDTRITVLVHPMKKDSGGYTDTSDEYPKAQAPESNEREMVYLNSQYLGTEIIKGFLAHEFTHLITFNQKDRAYNISDDVWLQEARAEYVSTLLGYDSNYQGSNLQQRVRNFLDSPSDSLTEWRETPADYGVVNLFIQYLVDHYGPRILVDSLRTRKTGIDSVNAALSQNNFKTNFSEIFADWAVAVLVNNCNVSEKYCYLNENLKNFRVTPLINYLPFIGESTLSVNNTAKDWSGNWHRFVGGKGELEFEFKAGSKGQFKLIYITEDLNGSLSVNNLELDTSGQGSVILNDFGTSYPSLTVIPLVQNKTSDFSGVQPSYSFFWSASTHSEKAEELIKTKEQKISELKAQIMEVQLKIIELLKQLIQMLLTDLSRSANM